MNKEAILEGLLFISGDEGLSLETVKDILELDNEELEKVLIYLQNNYNQETRGLKLDILGNNLKLTTKKEHKEYYQKLVEENSSFLSQSTLETLAIIAYNAPITRIKIDEIRGVNSSYIIRKLILKDLIKEVGKSNAPGRPSLYDTTSKFLDYFGLATKEDLPKMNIEVENIDNVELFKSKYQDEEEV